jgi:hypothetical protein
MISVWWTLVAFIGGGCAGVFLMALMRFAGDLPEQSETLPRDHLSQPDNEPRQFECQYFERSGQQMG